MLAVTEFTCPTLTTVYKPNSQLGITPKFIAPDSVPHDFQRGSLSNGGGQGGFTIDSVDYVIFHSPYGKQAVKGHAQTFRTLSQKASLSDKNLEKAFINLGKASFKAQVDPGMAAPSVSGKRISLYSFGSGCAASFFTIRVKGDTTELREKLDLTNRLAAMKVVPCQDFVDALNLREKNHNAKDYVPQGLVDNIWPGAYYLDSIDGKFRRKYVKAPVA
ncbi:thiolase-like protein [Gymnopus androsaceus JB14]|uniref:Thiolase-like protein n=1 Tax=Gymnopus androsaceus JB14 TaxID=1447944 RepID=A0A6A4IC29_9AGAR|nr:thiolase-like protein [Gymnopus androsaceus JB14]